MSKNVQLIGFETLSHKIESNFKNNLLHHAIILDGAKGIGKSQVAKEIIAKLIPQNAVNSDLLIITKEEGKRDLNVDQIRKISHFTNQTSAVSDNKFIIIDSACEMNKSASNALLKILEEPKKGNFLFLISHNLNRILPTIKSRCLIEKVSTPNFDNFSKIIAQNNLNFNAQDLKFLSELYQNSPALTIEFGQDSCRIYQLFLRSILNRKISETLSKEISDKNFPYFIFENIIELFVTRLNKTAIGGMSDFFYEEAEVFGEISKKLSTKRIFNLSDQCLSLLRKTQALYLDKKLTLINIFNFFC